VSNVSDIILGDPREYIFALWRGEIPNIPPVFIARFENVSTNRFVFVLKGVSPHFDDMSGELKTKPKMPAPKKYLCLIKR
jgi:hypothetical protein